MLRLVTWWKNFHRKVCLLPLIASCNYNPRVICANDVSNYSCTLYSREICRMWETVNPSKGFTKKKNCGRLIPDNEITSWSGGMLPTKRRNWYREIPLLSFIAPPVRFRPGTNIDLVTSSLSISDHFLSNFAFINSRKQIFDSGMYVLHIREKKKATKEIEILPTVKFSSHIPISMLS